VHAALEAGVELALAAAAGEHLGLDHELVGACEARGAREHGGRARARWHGPKFLATSYASSADLAGRLLGVGMPYCARV
jgi:hypothetical protein